MARNYRQTKINGAKTVASSGTTTFKISPLQTEQTPTGKLEKVKVSVIPSGESASDNSYMIHASSSQSFASNDIITAQAVPAGGGTVWLNVRRTLRDSDIQDDRNDGPVVIWCRSSQPNSTVDLICEAWGRFLEVDVL